MSAAVGYQYVAVDRAGVKRRGAVRASDEQDAYRKISGLGYTPVRLRPAREKKPLLRLKRRRVKPGEISHFTYQLSVLLEARIPIDDGLRSIAEQEPNDRLKKILFEIASAIQAGSSITDAMAQHRRVFGDIYVETVRAAERSGNLIKVLNSLSETLERQTESARQVRSALMYPAIVTIALGSAVLFLLAFVVPRFADMFANRGVDLPALTVALQSAGLFLRDYWWAYLPVLLAVGLGVRAAWRRPQGRDLLDRWLHRVPYLKRVLVGVAVSRFARVFGLSLGSGLGLIESLEMSGRAAGRPLLLKDTRMMIEQVRQGGRLADVLRECEYLPGFSRRMLAAGEQSAELTRMCNIVARHYDRETERLTKNAATIIEPILIAALTVVVLIIALAVFLPMWNMVELVG